MGDAGDDRAARPRSVRDTAVARAARLLWAAPASLAGLLLSPLFRARYVTRGIVLCEGAAWPRRLGWRFRAITFGHVVLSVDELDEKTLEHELVHVRQYETWGPLLWPAYVAASLWARLRGGAAYWDNHFERQARGHR
ncbi:MAG TPA: signal peptide prediction [Actinomycetota bacterium]|nr:signal peptide prediction [Actinomycetota bacterium]